VRRGLLTLSNTPDTIHIVRAELSDTVPVDTSSISLHVVVDSDLNVVSPVCLDFRVSERHIRDLKLKTHPNQRSRVLSIDQEALPLIPSIRVTSAVRNSEGIISRDARRRPLLVKVRVDAVSIAPAVAGCGRVGAGGVGFWVDCEGGGSGGSGVGGGTAKEAGSTVGDLVLGESTAVSEGVDGFC